ncbi:MAG TPA: acyclic terpene utilization AtuA family protein [Vineibacter sp.]|nr:acyclic terpene utilization AtuA family protein [Vineibacter sp.]
MTSSPPSRVIGCGAGFAGDRIDPAVTMVASGQVHAIALECLAERTLVPGLRARRADPNAGHDPRLERRLRPLLPVARANGCRVISNLGAANPSAAAGKIAALGGTLGLSGLNVAAVVGDDVLALKDAVTWDSPIRGELIGAHAYLGAEPIAAALAQGADVVVTGRCADSALFSADAMAILDGSEAALAGATTVGHLLECSGQITGGNFETVDGGSLSARDFAQLGFPLAKVFADGTAEIFLPDGAPGRVDRLTATLQLLYEVHDPARYITPDVILDFTGVRFEEIGRNRLRMTGAAGRGRPTQLKVSGFVEEPGFVADVEIGYAGTGALNRARVAADTLRLRLEALPRQDLRIDLVGVDSIIGAASLPAPNVLPEVRVHVSARCADAETAQLIEDEVYALTLSGPAGGGSVRSERRPSLAVVDGLIDRTRVASDIVWAVAP